MSTSQKTNTLNSCFRYLLFSLFVALFGAVYENFSHQVFSGYMIYAFAIPLALGALPCLWLAKSGRQAPSGLAPAIYSSGIATLTVGCLFEGVLRIYGTTNRLILVYPVAGVALMLLGLCLFLRQRFHRRTASGFD